MIDLYVEITSFAHELDELIRAFMPGKKVNILRNREDTSTGNLRIDVVYEFKDNLLHVYSNLIQDGKKIDEANETMEIDDIQGDKWIIRRQVKNVFKRCVYKIVSRFTDKNLDWGILTGIRPTKIVNEMLDCDMEKRRIFSILNRGYFISPSKAHLLIETVSHQRAILSKNHNKKISLYINIPFCTTKCLYCSFPSAIITASRGFLDSYIDALIYEITTVMSRILKQGYIVETIYIGGGTPTALSAIQLERVLKALRDIIPSEIKEYTVEGGRPDTLDIEKLSILKEYGVNRISINPQSMNEETLIKIGRNHTPYEIIECFNNARTAGFDFINMDVIVGLPGEKLGDIEKTMTEIYKLSPENVTIHTLAIKRGSPLKDNLRRYEFIDENMAENMLDICKRWMSNMNMFPYYLYRQKYMLGNLENIGYAKPGKECIYNIQMMEERQTVWAFGAGGISKIFYKDKNKIERVPNVKNYIQYIDRIDEMIARKIHIIE